MSLSLAHLTSKTEPCWCWHCWRATTDRFYCVSSETRDDLPGSDSGGLRRGPSACPHRWRAAPQEQCTAVIPPASWLWKHMHRVSRVAGKALWYFAFDTEWHSLSGLPNQITMQLIVCNYVICTHARTRRHTHNNNLQQHNLLPTCKHKLNTT